MKNTSVKFVALICSFAIAAAAGMAIISMAVISGLGPTVFAQSSDAPKAQDNQKQAAADAPVVAGPGIKTMMFISHEMNFGKTVTGAPYSAQAVTTFTQTLADGNRITRQTTAQIYRDSQGRTRREETFGGFGPWGSPEVGADAPQIIHINDPVAQVNYILNPKDHSAIKVDFKSWKGKGPQGPEGGTGGVIVTAGPQGPGEGGSGGVTVTTGPQGPGEMRVERHLRAGALAGQGPVAIAAPGMGGGFAMDASQGAVKNESLGKQTFEGIEADGTRTTVTIPAGKIGNELPLQIVSERWYSSDLQAVVMSKNSDPRMGETVYQLTNISRSEPSPDLFQVPAGYTINSHSGNMRYSFHTSSTPPEHQQ